MSAKISSCKNGVNVSKIAKIEESLNIFKVDEHESFLKICKENSEISFLNKNLQISDGSNKFGKTMNNYSELISILKSSSLVFEVKNKRKVYDIISKKLKTNTAATYYQISGQFYLPSLYKKIFRYIERCFCMVNETKNFLELEKSFVLKLFASSNIEYDSEVEIYKSANNWLNHNLQERRKLAKQLLLKVRLNLISEYNLEYLRNESSCISENEECRDILNYRESQNDFSFCDNSRHCKQRQFSIIVFGGNSAYQSEYLKQVKEICAKSLKELKELTSMLEIQYLARAVSFKGELYVFGGFSEVRRPFMSVNKYSPVNKVWYYVSDLPDERQYFCACSFMDKVYILGGHNSANCSLKSCLQFDVKHLKWKTSAEMTGAKSRAACAIFEGNIVISGGYSNRQLNQVESYDSISDVWTNMPNMLENRIDHSLLSIKRKLFAIGGAENLNTDCEVFNKTSNNFVALKTPELVSYSVKSVVVGNKIYVFQNLEKKVLIYDVDKEEWSENLCKAVENISGYLVVKVPIYKC